MAIFVIAGQPDQSGKSNGQSRGGSEGRIEAGRLKASGASSKYMVLVFGPAIRKWKGPSFYL